MVEHSATITPLHANPLERAYALLDQSVAQVEERLTETYRSTVALIPEVSEHLIVLLFPA